MRFFRSKIKVLRNKKSTPISRHPREYLQELTGLVVYQLYGIEKKFEVTRQEKEIELKTGHNIDYVLTCFELANILGQPASKVSVSVRDGITKWLDRTNPRMLEKFKAQAINGYVNFELSDEYISEAAYFVAHWLQKPQSRQKKSRTAYILTEGPVFGGELDDKNTNETLYFIHELYDATGCNIKSRYILSDASEDAVAKITDHLMQKYHPSAKSMHSHKKLNSEIEKTKYVRKIRSAVAGLDENSKDTLAKDIHKLRKEFLAQAEHAISPKYQDPSNILSESKLTPKVHTWLDKSVKTQEHIIGDGSSRSVYYHIKLGPLTPLRSASGMLFKSAYLLYNLDITLEEITTGKDILVVVAPQKYHQLMYSHADMVVPNLSYKAFICVDPLQARADMPEKAGSDGLMSLTYKNIAHTLAGAVIQKTHSSTNRAKLLALIDFPVELSKMAMEVRLLEAISLISSDIRLTQELGS